MRVFLFCVLVVAVFSVGIVGIMHLSQSGMDDQLDRIEEKLDTIIEIGEKWQ